MRNSLYIGLLLVLFTGCTGLHYVPEGKKLYTGAEVKIESEEKKLKARKYLKKEAEASIKPKPNKKFLGMRPALWIYYVTGGDSARGVKRWFRDKMGEEPVYFENVSPTSTVGFINAKMFNNGVFKALTRFETKEKKRTASVDYKVLVHPPYTYGSILWPQDSSDISTTIRRNVANTLIGKDEDYSLEVLKDEQKRIDNAVKNNGFFYFRPEYIQFIADTNEISRQVNLQVVYDELTPGYAKQLCQIGKVKVNQYFSLRADSMSRIRDSVVVDSVLFTGHQRIRPRVLLRSVFLREGELYSKKKHLVTLSRLNSLNSFQFVSVSFDSAGGKPLLLNTEIRLTPSKKQTARVEMRAVSKSNDFMGPGLNFSVRNRNAFRGAEMLVYRLETSYERQFGGGVPNIYSLSLRPEIELIVPRFVTPFKIREPQGIYIPQTRINVGYEFMRRSQYYNMTSFDVSYTYHWKENSKKDHELSPVFLNFVTLRQRSAQFDSMLVENPALSESFKEQFIAGINYTFTFDEQVIQNQRSQFYLQVKPETAGNLLNLLTPNTNEPAGIGGAVFSQYFRLSLEARNYWNLKEKERFVVRFLSGLGLPYGNSDILPYNKQFYSGGPSSIRAFRLNSLGPGIWRPEDPDINRFVFTQGGEVKLEGNVEYRFPIFKIVRGALFADAGNIWLVNENPSIDAPTFSFNRVLSEMGVGTGAGIRFDASFFVLRFDLAFPLRKPWLPEGERWVTDEIDFGSSSWRKENLILNIAIGYPF